MSKELCPHDLHLMIECLKCNKNSRLKKYKELISEINYSLSNPICSAEKNISTNLDVVESIKELMENFRCR